MSLINGTRWFVTDFNRNDANELFFCKKISKMADSKKLSFSSTPNFQYIFVKISQIGPWVSRINWCKWHQCGSTYMVVRLSNVSSIFFKKKCWCHSHHFILLTQGPICEIFTKIYWELGVLSFFESAILEIFCKKNIFLLYSYRKQSQINGLPWIALNFYYYHDFQKKPRGDRIMKHIVEKFQTILKTGKESWTQ